MKTILCLLFCCPLMVVAQGDVYLDPSPSKKSELTILSADSLSAVIEKFMVLNRVLSFSSRFETPGINSAQIRQQLITMLAEDARISLHQNSLSEDMISGQIKGFKVDYRKMGFSRTDLLWWAYSTLYADFVIQIREGRYRVLVKEIVIPISDSSSVNFNRDYVDENDQIAQINRKSVRQAYYAFGTGLDDLFDLTRIAESSW